MTVIIAACAQRNSLAFYSLVGTFGKGELVHSIEKIAEYANIKMSHVYFVKPKQ